MPIEVKHTTQATGTDAGNGEIRKAQWNEAHTLNMASGNLLGRSTSGAGAVEEISVGTGLSLLSGTLSATGGSSTLTIQNKTAAYTVVAGDNGTIINCSGGSFTISLTAAATLGAGFNCWVWNTSTTATDVITVDPNASETIDSRSTLALQRGEGMQIVCNGTNWQTGDKKVMRGYAENMDPVGGSRPAATGAHAISIGRSSAATADYSMALGSQANATAARSVSIGLNSSLQGSVTATGSGAMALGGSYASGSNSFAAAVANNTSSYGATGANAVAIGQQARSTTTSSVALGDAAYASGNAYGIAIGRSSQSSGTGSVCIATDNDGATASGRGAVSFGSSTSATAEASFALGRRASATIYGKYAYASGNYDAIGDAQTGTLVLRRATTDATATVLTSDSAAAATTNQVILPNNSAYAFTGTVVARQSAAGGTASAAWKVEGLIRRESSAGTTTLVASTVTAISNVPGWTLALSADTTNGGLAVTATGAAATNIRWVATIQTSEVTYA